MNCDKVLLKECKLQARMLRKAAKLLERAKTNNDVMKALGMINRVSNILWNEKDGWIELWR